jgi:uncharacterized membrane protein
MYNAIVLWLHILGAVLFIGPQVFLAIAGGPALRTLEDVKQRAATARVMTSRFGWLGGGALAVLVITGIINYLHVRDLGFLEFKRYFLVLQVKLTMVALVVGFTVLHGAIFGRRLQALQQSGAGEEEIAEVRRWSMLLSIATLALSIAILFCAALLASLWSKEGGLR